MEKAGYYLGKGWSSIKDGVTSVGSTIKQSSVIDRIEYLMEQIGKKTSKGVKKVKESQFSQKVKEGMVITGEFMKESVRKTGKAIQKTAKVTKNKLTNLTKERKQKSNETTLVEVSTVSQISDV